jgi:hypothetical protein
LRLIIYIHLVPKIWISETILPLLLYTFMALKETNLSALPFSPFKQINISLYIIVASYYHLIITYYYTYLTCTVCST